MSEEYSVALTDVVKRFHLEVLFAATDYESIRLTVADVAVPACSWRDISTTLSPCVCRSSAMWRKATCRSSPPQSGP